MPRFAAALRLGVMALGFVLSLAPLAAQGTKALAGPPAGPATLVEGRALAGALRDADATFDDGTHYQRWRFEGQAGDLVAITMTSDDIDPFLVLSRGDGALSTLVEDDDSGEGVNALIEYELPETGVYTVYATTYRPETGAYTISMTRTTAGPPVDYTALYPGGGNPADRYALLVGIDDYPAGTSDLATPINDARQMREMLIAKFGYRDENIVLLTDRDANRDHILQAFARHLGQAGPNGTALFYFSGHGTQVGDNVGVTGDLDPEDDGQDEAIAVWGKTSGALIVDDELQYLVSQLNTQRTVLVLDACHSGTGARSAAAQPKFINRADAKLAALFPAPENPVTAADDLAALGLTPKTLAAIAASPDTPDAVDLVTIRNAPYLLLAGCQDDQVSWTYGGWPKRGGLVSVFTYFLLEEMEKMTARTTFDQLMTAVQSQTVAFSQAELQTVQTPQINGTFKNQGVLAFFRGR